MNMFVIVVVAVIALSVADYRFVSSSIAVCSYREYMFVMVANRAKS